MSTFIFSKIIEEGIEAVKKIYLSGTKRQIDLIIEDHFHNYKGFYAEIKPVHDELRKLIGDLKFLEFLKQCQVKYPKPVYKISDEMKNFINESSQKNKS